MSTNYTSPVMLDSTGQDIIDAINRLASIPYSGGGGGASSEAIAPIEESSTASKAYAVGDLFFYENVLYKVTIAISSGGTIVTEGNNANVTETNIDSELKGKNDEWSSTATVSNGAVSFSGIDDTNNNGYKLFVNVTSSSTNKNPTSSITSISGTGTSSMSITFSTDADNGATCKLRIIK